MEAEGLIKELPKGLIKWYPFIPGEAALYINAGTQTDAVMVEALEELGLRVLHSAISKLGRLQDNSFDYIVIAGAIEYAGNPAAISEMLRHAYKLLKETGKLVIGADNRMGIRYFCGDKDAFTGRSFDGVENYARINKSDMAELDGRAYAKSEIIKMLETAGFKSHRFYSVFPVLFNPQILLAEDAVPQEELDVRIFPQYNCADTVFLEEEKLYSSLIENGMFHTMANGFFIECAKTDGMALSDAAQITVSMERGRKNAMYTIVRPDKCVEKKPVYAEGIEKISALADNTDYLQKHGVSMVKADVSEDIFSMSYQQGISAVKYFRTLIYSDQNLFWKRIEEFWKILLNSSEHVPYEEINWEQFEPGWEKRKPDDPGRDKWRKVAFGSEEEKEALGVILKRGYIDLVPLNCFWTGKEFVFYDQELYVSNLPAKTILLRTINFIYSADLGLEIVLPRDAVKEHFHLQRFQKLFAYFTDRFLTDLRNDDLLKSYHNEVRRDMGVVNSNRQRMNYSVGRYEMIFRDIFKGVEGKKLFLFGSGNFTKLFLSRFGADYSIEGILDNDSKKWGTKLNGIQITFPEILKNMPKDTYKVIICIKNYVPVMRQLDKLGISNYGVFDSNLNYPGKIRVRTEAKSANDGQTPKKYPVGYIAGVFDLFHVGHLNMFKRAKEQCDYLIVGVVNDESVMVSKRTTPFIPFIERIEMVRSCRYVDEAVEIPTEYNNTDEAYRRYQFDVQFSGSDYADNPIWLAKQAFLRKQGSDMVFFPYTESTSSTKIKEMIEKKLM